MITVINKSTGEVTELYDDTPEDICNSWRAISEQIKALEAARDKLKPRVETLLDAGGRYEIGDYRFVQSVVQRQTYDKTTMRSLLDADLYDEMLVPDKTKVDAWLKEMVERGAGELSTELRNNMVAIGKPYSIIRLERMKR
jgi:hypothetical protein